MALLVLQLALGFVGDLSCADVRSLYQAESPVSCCTDATGSQPIDSLSLLPNATRPLAYTGIKVLLMGNSYTYWNDFGTRVVLQKWVSDVDGVAIPGSNSAEHGDALAVRDLGNVGLVVFQDRSNAHETASFLPNLQHLQRAIYAQGANLVLYMPAARFDGSTSFGEINTAYQSASNALNVPVAPVALAFQKVYADVLHGMAGSDPLHLHDVDQTHPSAMGSYLAAAVIYYTTTCNLAPVDAPDIHQFGSGRVERQAIFDGTQQIWTDAIRAFLSAKAREAVEEWLAIPATHICAPPSSSPSPPIEVAWFCRDVASEGFSHYVGQCQEISDAGETCTAICCSYDETQSSGLQIAVLDEGGFWHDGRRCTPSMSGDTSRCPAAPPCLQ